jgi:hypothetical protein
MSHEASPAGIFFGGEFRQEKPKKKKKKVTVQKIKMIFL